MPAKGPSVRLTLLDTGFCLADERVLLRGGRRRTVQCHATVALLEHPRHGLSLFDTGYAPRVLSALRPWPFWLHAWATPLRLRPDLAVAAQLERLGVGVGEVRRVILSHFHIDHVGGLRDFPGAEVVASRVAYEAVKGLRGLAAVRRGFVPALMPPDFEARAHVLNEPRGEAVGALGPAHDLFGDGSVRLVSLPGHARGQLGLLARTTRGLVLLAADGCWLSRSYREDRMPHPAAGVFFDDFQAARRTLRRLHDFALAHPEVRVLPCHCPETLALVGAREP